jgi:hypothetical protein
MKSENDWGKINQAHVIAWRQTMAKQHASAMSRKFFRANRQFKLP